MRPLITSFWLVFALLATPAYAQTPPSVTPQPCIGIKMAVDTTLDARIEMLNIRADRIKSRLKPSLPDGSEKKALENALVDVQAQLLDLLFERECIRTDIPIQELRAPGQPEPAWLEITTFFATNRQATGNTAPDSFFSFDRRQDLQFGKTVVSIPTARKPGEMILPSLWKFELTADPGKHFILKGVIPLGTDEAKAQMTKLIGQSSKKSLLVFVHGYNVSFADAALRTAQLAHDLSFPGTTIFFSWPSAATAKSYWRDEEAVHLSQISFGNFLDKLGDVGASDIFIVAHSMGTRLVTSVLSDRASKNKATPNLRQLLLAAPDINAEIFREMIVPGLAMLQGVHRTIYASSSDLALRASKVVHDYRRVGDTEGGVLTFDGFETIDASAVAPFLRSFGHSYVVDSNKVLGDIETALTMGYGAEKRSLQSKGTPPAAWWILK